MLSAGCRFPAAGLEQVSIAAATAKRALWKEGSLVFNVSLLGGDAADHGIEVPVVPANRIHLYHRVCRGTSENRRRRGDWCARSRLPPAAADRQPYFEIARGSVFECAAIQDVLVVGEALDERESNERKIDLDRMAAC